MVRGLYQQTWLLPFLKLPLIDMTEYDALHCIPMSALLTGGFQPNSNQSVPMKGGGNIYSTPWQVCFYRAHTKEGLSW